MRRYHLRNGLFFERVDDYIVMSWSPSAASPLVLCKVPVHEWASAVASTSKRGETRETYDEALRLLDHVDERAEALYFLAAAGLSEAERDRLLAASEQEVERDSR